MTTALELLAAFVLIIGGAIGFTNAVEWLGHRMNLGEGAVGATLAAVGTALPESVIPIVALMSGGGEEAWTSRSARSSAPRSCSGRWRCCSWSAPRTCSRRAASRGPTSSATSAPTRRDLTWFLALMPVAIVLGAIGAPDARPLRRRGAARDRLRRLRPRGRSRRAATRATTEELDAALLRHEPRRPAEHVPDGRPVRRLARGDHRRRGAVRQRRSRRSPRPPGSRRWCSRSCSRRWPPRCPRRPTACCGCGAARTRWRSATSPAR